MHHEDRDAHRVMAEAVDSVADWHAKQMAGLAEAKHTEQWMRDCLDYRSMRPKFMTEDMRTYFGNDPVDFDLEGMTFYPPTIQEMLDLKAQHAQREKVAQIADGVLIIITWAVVIVGLMFTPALWHWARALWGAVHG